MAKWVAAIARDIVRCVAEIKRRGLLRAAGDILDMATVTPQLTSREERVQRANSLVALAIGAVAVLDVYCALRIAQQQ